MTTRVVPGGTAWSWVQPQVNTRRFGGDAHGKRVRRIASTAARLAGLPDPDAHAEQVEMAFLPDVLRLWWRR